MLMLADDRDATVWFLGWEAVDIPLLLLLPVLLIFSGFFSGSETALFSMTETERMHLRRRGSLAGRAIEVLLADQRMLLITVLLGNMTVNVIYFVVSSVLMMRAEAGVIGSAVLAVITLLGIVLLGEVMPKMLANTRRVTFASIVAPPLVTLHGLIGPVRILLDKLVVTPLSRLTAPREAPPQLSEEELGTLLEISGRQGVIDYDEQRLLRDVLALGRLRVRDVMTPRVRMHAVPFGASREEILTIAREVRLRRLPVYTRNLDTIVGMLNVRKFLRQSHDGPAAKRRTMERVQYVPQIATLDQLLDRFRRARTQIAIVVDEYGGTAGVVAMEDVVERLVGDIASGERDEPAPPRRIGPDAWEVDGDVSVHDWAEVFGRDLVSPRVSTIGGLIMEHLGRAPVEGDEVTLGNVRLEVVAVDRARVATARITLRGNRSSAGGGTEPRKGGADGR